MSANRYRKSPSRFKKEKTKLSLPKFPKSRFTILLSSLLALLLVPTVVFFTLAYKTDATDEVINEFNPKEVVIDIIEDFDGATKENVSIKNTGEVDAYIRFKITVSAIDKEGNTVILPLSVINTSQTVADLIHKEISISDFNIDAENWEDAFVEKNGIYYCTNLVPVGGSVPVFDKAEFNQKIFPGNFADLPLPLIDDNDNPYYVYNSDGDLCYKYNTTTAKYESYTSEDMTSGNYTSILVDGEFTYMPDTYIPVLTIVAESIQAEGVVDEWNVILDGDGNITGVSDPVIAD